MKKHIFVSILIFYFVITFYSEVKNLSIPQATRMEQAKIDDYQESIDRAKELKQKLQDPTIILNEFKKVGEIISFKGNVNYFKILTDKDKIFDKFTLREITIDYKYTYGVGISSLEYLKIVKIDGASVYINIPKNRVQLLYIQQSADSKIIDGDKMFFISQFSPSDTQMISQIVKQRVVNKIGASDRIFSDAMINLEETVKGLILKLGYKEVIFNIV